MDQLRALLAQMGAEENRLLSTREDGTIASTSRSSILLASLIGGSVVLEIGVLYLLRRLSKLQPLVNICAWSRTIEYNGGWISFEEYLKRRFDIESTHGISPDQAEKLYQKQHSTESKAG
jgi:hypothetical protein